MATPVSILSRQWITILIAVMGILACAAIAGAQWSIVRLQRAADVREDIERQWGHYLLEIKRAEDLQDTIVAFFQAGGEVRSEQFESFALGVPLVQFKALSFAQRVTRDQRADFERRRPGIRIWEMGAGGAEAVAGRDVLFPVTLVFPEAANRAALGFDLLSEARRRRALLEAVETGRTVRTDPIRLVQDPDRWSFLVFKAVYGPAPARTGGVPGGRSVIGVVSAVYQYGALLDAALTHEDAGGRFRIALFDSAEPSAPVFVWAGGPDGAALEALKRPLRELATLPGAHWVSASPMQHEISAVIFPTSESAGALQMIDRTIAAALALGLLLTAALAWNVLLSHRLAATLVRAEDAARSRKEEAEAANLAKSRVLAYASHDLRQPVHAMELFLAHLKEHPLPYETARIVADIDQCVHSLGELLDALLDLSMLDSGAVRPAPRALPVAGLWTQLQGQFAERAQARGLQLRFRGSRVVLMSDPVLLHRILLNLVSNALRYTRTGGVLVACRRAGRGARLEVWDTGIGIAPEHQEEIFREFVQLGNPESNRLKGLGLGLSIVRRTALLLGHRLTMRSAPGRGSCFRLEVPIAEPGLASTPPPPAVDASRFDGRRALVVEDDDLARRAIANLLREWGCDVTEASSAQAAEMALAAGCRPEIVVSDLRLPDRRDGVSLVARVRHVVGPDVAALLVSGDTGAEVEAAAGAAGLILLRKPVAAPRLRSALHLLLNPRLPAGDRRGESDH